jgi:aldehyde:ferredoxin oxidoreductase
MSHLSKEAECRAHYNIQSGLYKGKYDEGLEYTSLCAFGAEPDGRSIEILLQMGHNICTRMNGPLRWP